MPKTLYVLEVMTRGISCDVRVNDISVVQEFSSTLKTSQQKIMSYLLSDKNTLSVRLWGPDLKQSPKLDVVLMSGVKGTQPGEETIISRYTWTMADTEINEEYPRHQWHSEPFLSEVSEPWSWHTADTVKLQQSDLADVKSVVKSLETALIQKDIPKIIQLLHIKNTETSIALGMEENEMAKGMAEYLTHLFSDETWHLKPLDYATIKMSAQAEGKLYHIRNESYKGPFLGGTSSMPFELDISVSKVDGKWMIVR